MPLCKGAVIYTTEPSLWFPIVFYYRICSKGLHRSTFTNTQDDFLRTDPAHRLAPGKGVQPRSFAYVSQIVPQENCVNSHSCQQSERSLASGTLTWSGFQTNMEVAAARDLALFYRTHEPRGQPAPVARHTFWEEFLFLERNLFLSPD